MNPRCPAPEIQTAVLDDVRNAQELPSDLALHLDQCVACQIQVERLRRMAAVWTGDEVDDDALALAEAKFLARRGIPQVTLGWFDVVPFASAGVAAGLLLLVATGTVDLPWKSRADDGPARGPADMHAMAASKGLSPSDAPRVAPVFAASEETAKRLRARAHVETARGVAPLVNGLRLELKRGESAKVALSDGHASTVEGPCLVEFWSTPTEVGGWRMVREDAPARDERSPQPGTAPGERADGEESSAAETRAAPDESAAREKGAVAGQATAESPAAAPGAPASGANPSPAASSGRNAANESAIVAGNTPSKKSAPAHREGSAAAALDETVANNTQAAGAGTSLGSVRAWERAALALREDDFEGADRAFDELAHSANPATRDAARLARVQLWMSRGREREVRSVLEQLAQTGATPLVRRRATELLYRDVH
jgi:hypothetical protein